MYHYELRFGSYYLVDERGSILFMTDTVAICFSRDDPIWTLHKHGSPDTVVEWYESTVANYRAHGLDDIADSLALIEGKFPVDQLNRALDTTGYVKKLVKAAGFDGD